MSELQFHRLTAVDRCTYAKYYEQSQTKITDLTFTCRIAWDAVFKSEIAIYEDCCLLISDGGCFTDPHLLMPMGQLDKMKLDRILLAVRHEFDNRGWKCKVMCIDEEKLPLFEGLEHFRAEPTYNEDSSDYLYDAQALRSLLGNALQKKRNHVSKFTRLYPDYQYASLTRSDKDACLLLVANWCKSKGIDPEDVSESDYHMVQRLFDDFDSLEIHGGLIRIGDTLRAFAIGSLGNGNRAYIHFEKADPEIHGIYAAINQMVLQHEFPDVFAVNREEDLGISGLRKAKLSYEPIEWIKKYKTWLYDIK